MQPATKAYLTCVKCGKEALRYSSTIDGLRCQSCGLAYLNTIQVDARERFLLEKIAKLEARIENGWRDQGSEVHAPQTATDSRREPTPQ